jgi:cysteine synthase A
MSTIRSTAFASWKMGGRLAGREARLLPSVLDAVGNTPLVDLSRLVHNTPGASGRIVAKLENLNPGLSKKDRIALQMLDEARDRGELQPGQTVCELTSGNTGTGLAIVCAVLGHPCVLVMSQGNSIERVKMMEALGAEVVLVPQLPDSEPGQVCCICH